MFQKLERRIENIGFEKAAFYLILFFGICLRIVTPPFQTLDEINHLTRAWQVSEGIFCSPAEEFRKVESGNNPTTKSLLHWALNGKESVSLHNEDEKFLVAVVPGSMTPPYYAIEFENKFHQVSSDMIKTFLNTPLNPEKVETHFMPNTGQYSPLAYFPQALAAFFGRHLNFSAGAIYYAMCLSALFFVASCIFFSMKILPEKKFLIFLIAAMPMFLAEIISTSADAVIYGICLLGSAWLLSQRKNFDAITYQEIFLLILFSICLGLLKSVYGTILLLYFLMPRQRFKKLTYFIGFGIFLLLLELIVSSIWSYLAINLQGVELYSLYHVGPQDVDVTLQKNFILQNPAEFFKTIFNTVTYADYDIMLAKTFVAWFGAYNLMLPDWFCFSYWIILVVSGFFGKLNLKNFHRICILTAVAITILGIFTVEYLIWTSVGANVVNGVQGRYFIPIALFGFSIFSCLSPPKYANLVVLLIGTFSAVIAIWTICTNFYL